MTDRMKLALEFERLSDNFCGLYLGAWAGRGDWSAWPQGYRDNQGQRSLAELDAEIARLVEFRERLAAAVNPQPVDVDFTRPRADRPTLDDAARKVDVEYGDALRELGDR